MVGLVEERLEVGGGARVDCEEGVGKGREEAGQPVLQQGAFSVLVQRKMVRFFLRLCFLPYCSDVFISTVQGTALDKPPHLAAASFKPFADASLPRKVRSLGLFSVETRLSLTISSTAIQRDGSEPGFWRENDVEHSTSQSLCAISLYSARSESSLSPLPFTDHAALHALSRPSREARLTRL